MGGLVCLPAGWEKKCTPVKDEATSTTPFLLRRGGAGAFYGEGAEALNSRTAVGVPTYRQSPSCRVLRTSAILKPSERERLSSTEHIN